MCNDANAMQLKEKHDWAIIYRVNTTNKLKRQKRVGATTREFNQVFQPEVFPTKSVTNLIRKTKHKPRAKRSKLWTLFTNQQTQAKYIKTSNKLVLAWLA